MPTFIETRFNDEVAHGMTATPEFKTSVTEGHSGREQRNVNWSRVRHFYDVSMSLRASADMAEDVAQLFIVAEGRLNGFRFKDWTDYRFTNQTIGTGDGVEDTFEIVKTYTVGSYTYSRRLIKIVADEFVLAVDGVIKTEGSDYTLYPNTGHVVFAAPVPNGDVITCSGEFDVPVRFDVDAANATFDGYDSMVWDSLNLTEISREVEATITGPA